MLVLAIVVIIASYANLASGQASPCPEVLSFEPRNPDEPNRWYGVVMISTDEDLDGIFLRIFLDTRAELLGNWFGDTSSKDNTVFVIKNEKYKLEAGPPVSVRFFVQYDVKGHIPSIKKILLNGKTICSIVQTSRPTPPVLHISNSGDTVVEPLDIAGSSSTSNFNGEYEPNRGQDEKNRDKYDSNSGRPDPHHFQDVDQVSSNNDRNRRPGGSSLTGDGANYRPTSTSRTTTNRVFISNGNGGHDNNNNFDREQNNNNRYTTRSSGRRTTSSTTPFPDLTNIRDEHGRPVFDIKDNQTPSVNNNYNDNRHSVSTQRPATQHHSNKNQLSYHSNPNHDDDYAGEHDFFPGDYVNFINRPSSRPQSFASRVKPECGTVASRPNALISHGQNTTPGQWPWHVALYHSKGIQLVYTCGGTLISEYHIVTAAHCVTKPSTNQKVNEKFLLIYLGKYNLIAFGHEVQDRDVEEIYIHPHYNYSVYFNDIAVLKLSRPVELTNTVRPCCLWEGNTDLNDISGKYGTVVGWGFDEHKQLSRNLMQAQMPVVSTVKCIYSNREFFSQFTFENNFCAGFRNGTSVCNGDSGGGMVFPKAGTSGEQTVWQLRGVVSVGVALQTQGICDTSHFIIFTDVAKYGPWIKKVMSTNDT